MKTLNTWIVMTSLIPGGAFAETANFDDAKSGSLPPEWTAGVTGSGTAKYSVETDATAPSKPNVLKQSGEATYTWCVKTNASLVDGFVEVKFKPISGKEDQAGGLIWRWQDGDNYYISRANALEDNVTIYRTVKGVRKEYKRKNIKVASNQWHTLRVDFKGNHFVTTLDGKKALDWTDDTFKTAGAVGVWTKADSVTLFDDFSYDSKTSISPKGSKSAGNDSSEKDADEDKK